jgi:hypothetical protein
MASHREYYKKEGGGFPEVWAMMSLVSQYALGSYVHQKCYDYALINLLFGLCKSLCIIDPLVICINPQSEALGCPSYPLKCCKLRNVPQLLFLPLFSLSNSYLSCSKFFRVRYIVSSYRLQLYWWLLVLDRFSLVCSYQP